MSGEPSETGAGAEPDEGLDLIVYLGLLALTILTVGASRFGEGRLMATAIALIIACAKGSLIGFYYMGLRRERALMWFVLAVAVGAFLILLLGILPDMTTFRL